jgi:hypothetical protein
MSDLPSTTNGHSSADLLATGWALLADASWEAAYAAFGAAVDHDPTAEALEGLGLAAWWLDHADEALRLRERAFQRYSQQGDRRGAARVALWLSMDHFTRRGEHAIATGWLQRAYRLLDALDPGPEHGLAAVWEAHMAIMVDRDTQQARQGYGRAATLAQTLDLIDLQVLALAGEGFARVCEGEIGPGMRLLDEATTAVVAGELSDPMQ